MKKAIYNLPIITVFVLLGILMSCANDTAKDERKEIQGTIFSGSSNVKVMANPASRTSIDYTYPSNTEFKYYWEPGDYIWVENNTNKVRTSITAKALRANFSSTDQYTSETLYIRYLGQNSTAPNLIDLTGNVTQTLPNDTKHLGLTDCGDAIAQRQADGSYTFTLEHKLAFLCLLPRTPDGLTSTFIKEVKITSDTPIGGKCNLDKVNGLTIASESQTVKTISLGSDGHGFPLSNIKTSQSTNAIYIGIIPGRHTLTLEYKLYNERTQVTTTITKTLSPQEYAGNTLTPILSRLEVYDLNYYLWDAQRDYWYGKQVNSYDYPRETDNDGRWSNMESYPAQAKYSCKDCPNVNEIIWYIKKGDPYYDSSYKWIINGQTYSGGLWLKKQKVILKENPGITMDDLKNHAPNEATDYRISGRANHSSSAKYGRPAKLNDYFFLPSSGYYYQNRLVAGYNGYYWSSSIDSYYPWAYGLYFNTSGQVALHDSNYSRQLYGLRAWRAQ